MTKAKKAKARKRSTQVNAIPTLVITIDSNCQLQNNQGITPPHVCDTDNGGFPHQVKFQAVVHGWVCLPAGVFTKDPPVPLEVNAGETRGPFIVKMGTGQTQIIFSHACDGPCGALDNGDVIIINA